MVDQGIVECGQGEINLNVTKKDGTSFSIPVRHTLSKDQAAFVVAGSALNVLARKGREMKEELTRQAELSD